MEVYNNRFRNYLFRKIGGALNYSFHEESKSPFNLIVSSGIEIVSFPKTTHAFSETPALIINLGLTLYTNE